MKCSILTDADIHHDNEKRPGHKNSIMLLFIDGIEWPYFSPAVRPAMLTAEKPADRTAVVWKKPTANLVPTGICWTTGLPISKTRNKTHPVMLSKWLDEF